MYQYSYCSSHNEKHTNQSGRGYIFRLQDNNGGFLLKTESLINMHQVEFFFNYSKWVSMMNVLKTSR